MFVDMKRFGNDDELGIIVLVVKFKRKNYIHVI